MIDTSNLKLTNKQINKFFKEYEKNFFTFLKNHKKWQLAKKTIKSPLFKEILLFTKYILYLYTNELDINLKSSHKFLAHWNFLILAVLIVAKSIETKQKDNTFNELANLLSSKDLAILNDEYTSYPNTLVEYKQEIDNFIIRLYKIIDFKIKLSSLAKIVYELIAILLFKNQNAKNDPSQETKLTDQEIINYLNLFKIFRKNIMKSFPTFFNHLIYIINC